MATPATIGDKSGAPHGHGDLSALTLAAIGVVYGDIGTSPLHTMREAFGHAGGLHLSAPAVLGVLSLVFWALILVVTVKYVVLILRADNRGEGGVIALGTLASHAVPSTPALCWLIPALTIAGLALFYGDGLITPAISVLPAVEGLETAAPGLVPYIVPIAALVLLGLFLRPCHQFDGIGRQAPRVIISPPVSCFRPWSAPWLPHHSIRKKSASQSA